MKKIAVIVNKNWEMEGVMGSMVSAGLHPSELPFPDEMYIPHYDEKTDKPRAVFSLPDKDNPVMCVTIRCIQDLMNPKKSSSSSEEKYRVLKDMFEKEQYDLVMSVSTAGYPDPNVTRNGSVVIGGNFFLHDGHPKNEKSNLVHRDIGRLLPNNVNPRLYSLISTEFKNSTEPKFLKTPQNPCDHPACIASDVFTALSAINVTEYQEYNWVDEEALEHYKRVEKRMPLSSSETTHGVVKLCTKQPIIFISPITDQFGHFDFEVTPTQNYAASFNAGVVIGHLLCALVKFIGDGNELGLE